MVLEFGDRIKVNLLQSTETVGLFIKEDKETILIKLDSGYNKIIKKSKIKSIETIVQFNKLRLQKEINETFNEQKFSENKNSINTKLKKPKILFIQCGGTISSSVDYVTGAVTANTDPEQIVSTIPELKNLCEIKTKKLFNLMSGNIRFNHINKIAEEVLEASKLDYSGIIISHGTDTMAYSSAGLSFILQNIKMPVVIVGSQRSPDRPSSDAVMNFLSAVYFILDQNNKQGTGFFVSMHGSIQDTYCNIYSGINLKKLHTSRRDAFKQINNNPIAKVYTNKKIEYFYRPSTKINTLLQPSFLNPELKIGVIKSHPNLMIEEFNMFKNFDAVIIEGTGLGHLPITVNDKFSKYNQKIHSAISNLTKTLPVIITTQAIHGRINLNIYDYGRELKKMNVLSADSMSFETAFMKTAWILSTFHKNEFNKMWKRNFVGELNSITLYKND